MGGSLGSGTSAPQLDIALLAGFRFSCLPGCGLCCFTSPRLEGDDERHLRDVAPDSRVVFEDGVRRLSARPDGGACQFLRDLRCSVHGARPAPCREFPISVHVGSRLQATVVLSCPGLSLDPLAGLGGNSPVPASSGLDAELSAVRDRLTPAAMRRRAESERRGRRIARTLERQGRWVAEEEVRRQLRGRRLLPTVAEFSRTDPPEKEEGLEFLPLYYDGRPGPVALAQGLGGWEALEVRPEGGGLPLAVGVPPDTLPTLDEGAETVLSGYLRYWLERDAFLAATHIEMLSRPMGTVVEVALEDLHAIASTVLARGAFRAKLRGEDGTRLARADVERGIRATDQDWLDRPTWGARL